MADEEVPLWDQSILESVKPLVGVEPEDDSFDVDLVSYINSVFSTLHDLGVGPVNGFMIQGPLAKWSDFFSSQEELFYHVSVQSYVGLKVRLMFDMPASGFAIDATKALIDEHEWRIRENREQKEWTLPLGSPYSVAPVD